MSIHDGVDVGILGLLSGSLLPKGERMHRQLACGVLGSAIGALVDAGLSDSQINSIVELLLKQIREMLATPDPLAALADHLTGDKTS